MNPTVTVGIPFYNKDNPQKLNLAISSILQQSLKPTVIHLVQNGPIDQEIKSVIKNFNYDCIRHIILDENYGLSYALNCSIAHSDTKYYARMDADDIALNDRIEKQIKFLEENPEVDILGGAIEIIDDEENHIGFRNYPLNHRNIREYVHLGSPLAHPTVVFRKAAIEDCTLYNVNLKVSQDIELWFRLLEKGLKFANLDNVILKYRFSKNFYDRRGYLKAKDELIIYLRGIQNEFGFTPKQIFPLIRFISRCSPKFIKRFLYKNAAGKFLNNRQS